MADEENRKSVFQSDSILKMIFTMAVPTVISQMITALYNYADTIFIGQLEAPKQVAAITLALPLTLFITAVGNFWGIGLTLGGILNIVLDPIFIFPFDLDLGVEGAAIATMLSNVISLVFFAIPVLSVGLPSALISLLSAVSNGVLNNLISKHGDVVVAAVGIAKKMDILPANVAIGITQGSLPLIAYSYGAKEKEKTRKLLYTTGVLAFTATAVVVILLEIFATPVASLFIRDTETVQYATQFIRRLCISIPLYAITITINSFFHAVNRPRHAFAISIICKGIFDLPLMVLFDSLFAVTSIIWVQPIMDLLTAIISLIVLRFFLYKSREA